MDEIFTWNEVRDRSLWHLYSAVQRGADGGMPLFYTTAWLWAKSFGSGVLSLRLYSSVAMCAALLVTWKAIRRYYSMWATAFGVLLIWGTSGTLLDQNAEGRYYGLFMLAAAVSVEMYSRLAAKPELTRRLLLLIFCSQAALVLVHVLGLIYSGVILLALVLTDVFDKRVRLKVYFAWAAGWLALLVWLPAIRASAASGKPHGWIPLPRLGTVLNSYFFYTWLEWIAWLHPHPTRWLFDLLRVAADLLIFVPLVIVLWMAVRKHPAVRNPLLPVAWAVLSVPLILYLLSHLFTPVFVLRYTLPSGIGMAIVLAAFAAHFRIWRPLIVVLLISPVCSALLVRPPQVNAQSLDVAQIDSLVPGHLPLVAGWQNDFSVLMRYSADPKDRFYLLDWPTALAGENTAVVDYHLMHAYRSAGYYAQNIQDQGGFLCSHDDFVVLDPHFVKSNGLEPSWFDLVIRNKPQFQWRLIATVNSSEIERRVIAVHRSGALPFCEGEPGDQRR
jgi:hypothetical protein